MRWVPLIAKIAVPACLWLSYSSITVSRPLSEGVVTVTSNRRYYRNPADLGKNLSIADMSKSCNRRTEVVKTFRVTPEENEIIRAAAEERGLGVSTFSRNAALKAAAGGSSDSPAVQPNEAVAKGIGVLIAATTSLQIIVRRMQTEQENPAVPGEEIIEACDRIAAAARVLLGEVS